MCMYFYFRCGNGDIFHENQGFITKGKTITSPAFSAFRIRGSSIVDFDCSFIICDRNCDGVSRYRGILIHKVRVVFWRINTGQTHLNCCNITLHSVHVHRESSLFGTIGIKSKHNLKHPPSIECYLLSQDVILWAADTTGSCPRDDTIAELQSLKILLVLRVDFVLCGMSLVRNTTYPYILLNLIALFFIPQ